MDRNATLRLTPRDKDAARKAILDDSQGVIRQNGSL